MNGGPVARDGLIFGEGEAATPRKLSKHLQGALEPVFGHQKTPKVKNPKNPKMFVKNPRAPRFYRLRRRTRALYDNLNRNAC